jgi:hypothetical protein
MPDSAAPTLSYWHVWTDDDGVSRQSRAQLSGFEQQSMGGGADPQWNDQLMRGPCQVLFSTLPAGWEGDWHENPRPQWIVPLSGRWYVETMDGERVEMGPGDVSFGGDQNTVPDAEGRKGHRSGTVGEEPCTMMIVQLLGDRFVAARPGDFEE